MILLKNNEVPLNYIIIVDKILDVDIPIMDITDQITPPLNRKQHPVKMSSDIHEDLQDLLTVHLMPLNNTEISLTKTSKNSPSEYVNSTILKPNVVNNGSKVHPSSTAGHAKKQRVVDQIVNSSDGKQPQQSDAFNFVNDMMVKQTPLTDIRIEADSIDIQTKTISLGRKTNRRWDSHNSDRGDKTRSVIDNRAASSATRIMRKSDEY